MFVSPISSLPSHITAMSGIHLGRCREHGVIRSQQPGGLKNPWTSLRAGKRSVQEPSPSQRPKTKQAAWFHVRVKVGCKISSRKCTQFLYLWAEGTKHLGLHFQMGEQVLENIALLAGVLFPSTSGGMFPMQKVYGWFLCLFFQNANHQNNTLKHHFHLICQRTIKSFLDAIRLQDNKDYKQASQLSIKKITIQLYDLRDLAIDKVPFRGTSGNLSSLWKPYTSPKPGNLLLVTDFLLQSTKGKALFTPFSHVYTTPSNLVSG